MFEPTKLPDHLYILWLKNRWKDEWFPFRKEDMSSNIFMGYSNRESAERAQKQKHDDYFIIDSKIVKYRLEEVDGD